MKPYHRADFCKKVGGGKQKSSSDAETIDMNIWIGNQSAVQGWPRRKCQEILTPSKLNNSIMRASNGRI